MKTFSGLSGKPWLEEFIGFLSGPVSKDEVIAALGALRNHPQARLLSLKPLHPSIHAVQIDSDGVRILAIDLELLPEFDLTQRQVMDLFPRFELVKNTYDSQNQFVFTPTNPKFSSVGARGPLGEFAEPVRSLSILLADGI